MVGYRKGDTPEGQLGKILNEFAFAIAAIQAEPQASDGWQAIEDLRAALAELESQAARYKGYYLTYLKQVHGLDTEQLTSFTGLTRQRLSRLITEAERRGFIVVVDPVDLPEQAHVALAVIARPDRGVLIARRHDGKPPWTFPGGDMLAGETLGDAVKRRVLGETGLPVAQLSFIDRREHPVTGRIVVYVLVDVHGSDPVNGDPEDLAEVRWVPFAEAFDLMPTMYKPVKSLLEQMARGASES